MVMKLQQLVTQPKSLSSKPLSKLIAVVCIISFKPVSCPYYQGLDRTNTHATVESACKSGLPAGKKVNRPAIKVNTVYKVSFTLRRFAEVLFRKVERIRYSAISILVIDTKLAPYISLTNVNDPVRMTNG
jgi:hypothetical protein